MTSASEDASQPEAPIEIAPYDSMWPSKFAAESELLQRLLAPWLTGPIEHVGSTAIPGMPAKPVIDIMAAVESLEASKPAIHELAKAGYLYFPYRPDEEHWFCKPSPAFRTYHLHLVPLDSLRWVECLKFRDTLRCKPALAAEYGELKKRLAETFKFDREAYTASKTPFIQKVLQAG
jgi:GrpB-like predicted nucleotidyltransferase (UPF0157 family)